MSLNIILKREDIKYLFMIIGVLLFGYYIRLCILPDRIAKINFMTTVPMLLILLDSIRYKASILKNSLFFITIAVMSFFFFQTQKMNNRTLMNTLLYYFNLILPLWIISFSVKTNDADRIINAFILFMDVLVLFMFSMLLLDIVTHNKIISFFSKLTRDPAMIVFSNGYSGRKASIMGHYLPTSEVYIIYYVIHYLVKKKHKVMYYVSMIVSVFGVSMAASKSGILLIICLVLFFNVRHISSLFFSISALIVAYISGLFDAVINRFLKSDLTSGRSDMWRYLNNIYDDLTPFFYGHGSESTHSLNRIHNWASAAFEYPFRTFVYEYGVVFTVLFYALALGYPLAKLIKQKRFDCLICFCAVFAYSNTFNGWVLGYDYVFLYCVFVFIILNMNNQNGNDVVHRLLFQLTRCQNGTKHIVINN